MFDYQLDRHCSKTNVCHYRGGVEFDYQLDRHCSKTRLSGLIVQTWFDYQLDRHCSKTKHISDDGVTSLITS